MNAFNVIATALLGAPTAYTAVVVLRNSALDLMDSRVARNALDQLPDEPRAVQMQQHRRHAVRLALMSIALAAVMVTGIVLAVTVEALFWPGALGGALCALAYWVMVRPRQAALAGQMSGRRP